MLSASVDGVVKVWSLKKQQCLNTWEMHEEKIWALEILQKEDEELQMITGGSDSYIRLW
jgi:U3 small nucleolar RNA-associated protein 13